VWDEATPRTQGTCPGVRGSIRWGPELSPRGAIAQATLMELGQSGPRTQSESPDCQDYGLLPEYACHPTFYTRHLLLLLRSQRSGIKGVWEVHLLPSQGWVGGKIFESIFEHHHTSSSIGWVGGEIFESIFEHHHPSSIIDHHPKF
jgi:hypothetical protein